MKLFILFLIFISACGKSPVDPGIGVQRDAIQGAVSEEDKNAWISLCSKLQVKDEKYKTFYLNAYTKFNFKSWSTAGCTNNDDWLKGVATNVQTKLKSEGDKLTFEVIGDANFSSFVETNNSGLISAVCDDLKKDSTTLLMPIKKNSSAQWFSLKASGCSSSTSTACVRVETGFRQDDTDQYKILIQDNFTIALESSGVGNVTRHERQDISFCEDDKKVGFRVNLEGISN